MNKFISILGVGLIFLAQPVWAEVQMDEAEQVEQNEALPAVLEVDYEQLESIGLYSKGDELYLGPNLWRNTERSVVQALIKNMPVNSRNPIIQNLIEGILLSKSDISELEDDVEVVSGKDLLTLRLNKLIEAGAYDRAFSLYGQLESDPYHKNLARAGVLSMLLNGEKSSACLEINTLYPRFKGDNLWESLSLFCDATLSEEISDELKTAINNTDSEVLKSLANKKDYRFSYTPENFAKLDLLDRAFLSAEHALDLSQLKKVDVRTIPPSDLLILLHHDHNEIDDNSLFSLIIESASWGLVDSTYLGHYYEESYNKKTSTKETLDPNALGKILNLLKKEDDEDAIASSMKLLLDSQEDIFLPHKGRKNIILTPFAKFVADTSPKNFTFKEIFNGVAIMVQAGLEIPENWITIIDALPKPEDNYSLYVKLLAASYISKPSYRKTAQDLEKLGEKVSSTAPHIQNFLINVIENVDKEEENVDNALAAYEKHDHLTFSQDYVMPYVAVWDRLKLARNKHTKAETILLNIVLFSDHTLQNTYPGLLRDGLHSMEYVDFNKVSKKMAIEALLIGQ